MEIIISLFFAFSVLNYSLAARNGRFFRKFAKKNQFLELKKNDVYENWKLGPGIETKDLQGVKSVRK